MGNYDYANKCDYCHEEVSCFEHIMEFGKHYHEACMIHKLHKEIDSYKKKWIDRKLTDGDLIIIKDKWELSQKLIKTRTVFKGWKPIKELKRERGKPEKLALSNPDGTLILDENNKPIFKEVDGKSTFITYCLRPDVQRLIKAPPEPGQLGGKHQVRYIEEPENYQIESEKQLIVTQKRLTANELKEIMEQI